MIDEDQRRSPPGGTVDIRIQLPELSLRRRPTTATSTVELTFVDATPRSARGHGARCPTRSASSPPLHERECRAQALADAATVTFTSFAAVAAGRARRPRARRSRPPATAGPRIAEIQSTNLLDVRRLAARRSFPIDLTVVAAATPSPSSCTLPLVPLRCDPHAVQEDKRGTVFDLEVELDGEPGLVQVAADEEMRGRILTWVADWCGFGQG